MDHSDLSKVVEKDPSHILRHGDIVLNIFTKRVMRDGKPIPLSESEFELLATFVKNKGRVFSASQLYEEAKGPARRNANDPVGTIKVQIYHIRKKLGEPNIIKSEDSKGYSIPANSDPSPIRVRKSGYIHWDSPWRSKMAEPA